MIGIIEKVIVDSLLELGGDELRQDVFFVAKIPNDRIYRIDRHYDDGETMRLIEAVLQVTGLETSELFDLLSEAFLEFVEGVFPEFLRMSRTSEDLVRKQAKIHALIAAGSRKPGDSQKSADKFRIEDHGPHHITVHYQSQLQLCGFYEALVRAAAKHFGDEVVFASHECAHEGANACRMTMKWTSVAGTPTFFTSPQTHDHELKSTHG
ncbi:heme NO-binding domain-containing protein [uncultured Roseobacter sp.]|uniref:heme NO-binding domain-containing protein n=1 Tax=uncultured Roseobacter sp. TaxID=114847 RepID=UPI00261E3281|nr:heme NO-binding domain-containing protein [uncultured Roseobacter sp.]